MKKNIINVLNYVVGISTAIVILLFHNNLSNAFIGISVCCVFIGILLYLQDMKYGVSVSGIGISGIVTYIIYKCNILILDDCITFYMSTSLCFNCLLSIIFDFITRRIYSKKYSMMVVGTVIDLEKNNNTKKKFYKPIYEYTIDGISYECEYSMYLDKRIPNVGDKLPIFVDPDDYTQMYFKPLISGVIKSIIISLVFVIACIVIDITLFI